MDCKNFNVNYIDKSSRFTHQMGEQILFKTLDDANEYLKDYKLKISNWYTDYIERNITGVKTYIGDMDCFNVTHTVVIEDL